METKKPSKTGIITPDQAYMLRTLVDEITVRSTVGPGERISVGENLTGRSLLLPGINTPDLSTYPAFWTRDPAWLAESGLVGADDAWGWLTLLANAMHGHTPRFLESGGVIRPFSIPDHINLDGSPVYYPGTYDAGETQGPPWGKYPPHDDQYWLTFTAHACLSLSGDENLGLRAVDTVLGPIPVWLACDLSHHAFPVDPDTGLCLISDADEEHQVDWGYNDSIHKTGKVLFPSLLRLESSEKLSRILAACGLQGRASFMQSEARALRGTIPNTFVRRFEVRGRVDTWLVSATGTGNIPDVWGTALAIHRGYLPEAVDHELRLSLLNAYREGTAVLDGQVCHVPSDYGFWPKAQSEPGIYQNGGYWGYPVGWYVSALSEIDPVAASELFSDFLEAMKRHGVERIYECINPGLNHYQNPGYLTSVALPYVALREAGLIEPYAPNIRRGTTPPLR